MGCGNSKPSGKETEESSNKLEANTDSTKATNQPNSQASIQYTSTPDPNENNNKNAQDSDEQLANGIDHSAKNGIDSSTKQEKDSSSKDNNNAKRKKRKKKKADEADETDGQVPKSFAFEVEFDDNKDHPLKPPPPRLQKLTPLPNALTKEQLDAKIRLAEEKRQQELEKKKQTANRTTVLHKQLQDARELSKESFNQEIAEKQKSADRNREAKHQEMMKKKQERELRAKQARERAARIKAENGETIDFELEKDEEYNHEDRDLDSWLDGENNMAAGDLHHEDTSERLYSGRESPRKILVGSGETRARAPPSAFSASTTDSFDYAFQRKPPLPPVGTIQHDDFFDT